LEIVKAVHDVATGKNGNPADIALGMLSDSPLAVGNFFSNLPKPPQNNQSFSARFNDDTAQLKAQNDITNAINKQEVAQSAQLTALKNQLPVVQAIGAENQRIAQYAATIDTLTSQNVSLTQAIAIAEQQYTNAQQAAVTTAEQQTKALQDQNELAKANTDYERQLIASRQAYNQVLEQTGDAAQAAARAAQVEESYRIKSQKAAVDEQQAMLGVASSSQQAADAAQQAADAWEKASRAASMAGITDSGGQQGTNWGFDTAKGEQGTFGGGFKDLTGTAGSLVVTQAVQFAEVSPANSVARYITKNLAGGIGNTILGLSTDNTIGNEFSSELGAVDPELQQSNIDAARSQAISHLIDALAGQGTSALPQLQQLLDAERGNGSIVGFDTFAKLSQAVESLQNKLDKNTIATTDNTAATVKLDAVLPGTLSSLYASGQVAGFGFADGGIMTPDGPMMLRSYSGGGIADTPQVAVFGEGRVPEAYVPVPSGKIPVQIMGGGDTSAPRYQISAPITMNIVVQGPDPGGQIRQAGRMAVDDMRSMINNFS
jgi:hypothetical protein